MNQFCPPNSSEDLCLFFCIYPCSMLLTHCVLRWSPTSSWSRAPCWRPWSRMSSISQFSSVSLSNFLVCSSHRVSILRRGALPVYSPACVGGLSFSLGISHTHCMQRTEPYSPSARCNLHNALLPPVFMEFTPLLPLYLCFLYGCELWLNTWLDTRNNCCDACDTLTSF